jgi:hypothetical protein
MVYVAVKKMPNRQLIICKVRTYHTSLDPSDKGQDGSKRTLNVFKESSTSAPAAAQGTSEPRQSKRARLSGMLLAKVPVLDS